MKSIQEQKEDEIRPLLENEDVKLLSINYNKVFDLTPTFDDSKLLLAGVLIDHINFQNVEFPLEIEITATFRVRSDTPIGKMLSERYEQAKE